MLLGDYLQRWSGAEHLNAGPGAERDELQRRRSGENQISVKQTPRIMNSGAANIPARDWHNSMRQSTGDFYTLLHRVTWLAAFYGVLIVTVTAQEPPLERGVVNVLPGRFTS